MRNALFLTTTDDGFLQAAGLLLLWSRGYVEPVTAPPSPRHIAAQQIFALCLQERRVGDNVWGEWWDGLPIFDEHAEEIVEWLIESGHLDSDGGMLAVGPETERRFGHRHFMEIVSVFTTNPEFTVLQGRQELGKVDPIVLTRKVDGPRIIVLAARSWAVTYIDWKRQRCYVEPSDNSAKMRWMGDAAPLSFALARAERDVLLGEDPTVTLSKRATEALDEIRTDHTVEVSTRGLVLLREKDDVHWWTWAGARANATLIAGLPGIADDSQRPDNLRIRLCGIEAAEKLGAALEQVVWEDVLPAVSTAALAGLKFSEVLPPELAKATIAERLADRSGARSAARDSRVWASESRYG